MEYQLDIDGYIGPGGYTKQYCRNIIDRNKGRHINVRISSFGGSLDDALDIAARLNEHGDATVYLYAYCASAATIIALGGKETIIDENAFYLIHKVMNWVDVWGSLNADQMAEAIAELEANKRENDKMDLVLARMYAKKCGKPVDEILDILKAGDWLTAQEAYDLGFCDQVGKGLSYDKPTLENKLNAFGLPLPIRSNEKRGLLHSVKQLIIKTMKKDFLNLNALLNVEGFDEEKDNIVLTTEQVTTIDNRLKADAEKVNALESAIADKEARIAELEAQVTELQAQPAEPAPTNVEPEPVNVDAHSLYENIKNLI